MLINTNTYLKHYGKKGMKWGHKVAITDKANDIAKDATSAAEGLSDDSILKGPLTALSGNIQSKTAEAEKNARIDRIEDIINNVKTKVMDITEDVIKAGKSFVESIFGTSYTTNTYSSKTRFK